MAEYICKNGVLRPVTHIYQCVDKLVEGIDYISYKWLKGDRNAYIDTRKIVDLDSLVIETIYRKSPTNESSYRAIMGSRTSSALNIDTCAIIEEKRPDMVKDKGLRVDINAKTSWWSTGKILEINDIYINMPQRKAVIQGIQYDNFGRDNNTNNKNTFLLFSMPYLATLTNRSDGYFSDFMLSDKNFKMELTPIQLLKDIPPKFSSQNKIHYAGECGMIDAISGNFFGNANKTGSFSAYND